MDTINTLLIIMLIIFWILLTISIGVKLIFKK